MKGLCVTNVQSNVFLCSGIRKLSLETINILILLCKQVNILWYELLQRMQFLK